MAAQAPISSSSSAPSDGVIRRDFAPSPIASTHGATHHVFVAAAGTSEYRRCLPLRRVAAPELVAKARKADALKNYHWRYDRTPVYRLCRPEEQHRDPDGQHFFYDKTTAYRHFDVGDYLIAHWSQYEAIHAGPWCDSSKPSTAPLVAQTMRFTVQDDRRVYRMAKSNIAQVGSEQHRRSDVAKK